MAYSDQALIDLVENPSFRAYVLGEEGADLRGWQQWLEENPEKRELAQEAAAIINMMEGSRSTLSREEVQGHWQDLATQIGAPPAETSQPGSEAAPTPKKTKKISPWNQGFVWLIAASITFLLLTAGALGWWGVNPFEANGTGEVITAFGQIQRVSLPDGSEVVLNANSSLHYDMPTDTSLPRKVWLSGEAFFEVTQTPRRGGRSFQVHSKGLLIKVLGTAFNVNNRGDKNEVLLDHGKVALVHKDEAEPLSPKPGELASLDPGKKKIEIRPADKRLITSWIENRVVFEQTTVEEIGQLIWDRYGVEVMIANDSLAQRQLSGEAVVVELDDLLLLLRITFGIQVEKKGNTLYLKDS